MNTKSDLHQHLLHAEPTRLQKTLALAVKMQWWIVLAITVMAALFYFLQPLPDTTQQQSRLAALEKEKTFLIGQRDKISRRIAWMKDEKTGYLELVARDHLDWQKDGEVIVQIRK